LVVYVLQLLGIPVEERSVLVVQPDGLPVFSGPGFVVHDPNVLDVLVKSSGGPHRNRQPVFVLVVDAYFVAVNPPERSLSHELDVVDEDKPVTMDHFVEKTGIG
jgi:hypothetical protein